MHADEDRLKADTETVHRQHIEKNSLRWEEFLKVMDEVDVFNPKVFKEWKEIILRIYGRLLELEHTHQVKTDKCHLCELKKELVGIKDGYKEKESPKEKETPVPSVRKTVHL